MGVRETRRCVHRPGGRRCADRGVYDYSDYHFAARVCTAIPAGAVPDVLERACGGRDRFLDCAALRAATQRVLTLLGVAAGAAPICRPRLSSTEAQSLIEPALEAA